MKQSYFLNDPKIKPYTFQGLQGRYAHWPAASAKAKRTFVLVYGQHATIERLIPIIEALTDYGDVYLPDNPGFGGMESAFEIKRYPDLEFYGQHLKHFIDNYVPADRQLTLFGISYGFQALTQMLHDYPELNPRVEQLISFVGFPSYKDFHMPKHMSIPLKYILAGTGRTRLGAAFYDHVMSERLICFVYAATKPIQAKFKTLSGEEAKRYAREQAWLWLINDNRTHAATGWDFFCHNDLTDYRLDVDAIHIGVPADHLLDNSRVENELSHMFSKMTALRLNLDNHAPLDIDSADKVRELLPDGLDDIMKTSANQKAVTA